MMLEGNLVLRGRIRELRETQLPADVVGAVQTLEEEDRRKSLGKKIAVFDLDNTLLVGDIGDAVFAELGKQGCISGISWIDYKRLLKVDRKEALAIAVSSMKGLSESLLHRITFDLLSRGETYLEWEKSYIPVPYAHPVMLQLVRSLRRLGYQLYIITASNEISARLTAWKLFGIPPFAVFGMRQRVEQGNLTDQLLDPLPVDEGKVDIYRQFIGDNAPLISAGDSILDFPMLRMTDPRGFTIWVGEERAGFELAQQRVGRSHMFCFVERPSRLEVDEEGADV